MQDIAISISGGEYTASEAEAYIARGRELYGRELERMEVELDGEYANVRYYLRNRPFERIRRITGYLVGTLDRFNNAKRSEEGQRVKHALDI